MQNIDFLIDLQELGIYLSVFGEALMNSSYQIYYQRKFNFLVLVNLLEQIRNYLVQLSARSEVTYKVSLENQLPLLISLYTCQNLFLQNRSTQKDLLYLLHLNWIEFKCRNGWTLDCGYRWYMTEIGHSLRSHLFNWRLNCYLLVLCFIKCRDNKRSSFFDIPVWRISTET